MPLSEVAEPRGPGGRQRSTPRAPPRAPLTLPGVQLLPPRCRPPAVDEERGSLKKWTSN
ncbi:hypothetical protein Nmel_012790 [Mimus melanotis]